MTDAYAQISQAFRQPTTADIYMGLIVEALVNTGTPYSVPQLEAYFVNYITTTYPLFTFDLATLQAQLARALRYGLIIACEGGYIMNPNAVHMNPLNVQFTCGRCAPGYPVNASGVDLISTKPMVTCGGQDPCGSGFGVSVKTCTIPIDKKFGCKPSAGCCAPLAEPACTPCCSTTTP